MKTKIWALCLLLVVQVAVCHTITFGTDGDQADLLAAFDVASDGDSLVQVGSSAQAMTGAKTYTGLDNITVVGLGIADSAITITPTSASHDLTFDKCTGLTFVDCADLRFYPTFSEPDVVFENCALQGITGAVRPHAGDYALLFATGGGTVHFTGCECLYAGGSQYHVLSVGDAHSYTIQATSTDFYASLYVGGDVLSTTDLSFSRCRFLGVGGHMLGYRVSTTGITVGDVAFSDCLFDSIGVRLGNCETLTCSGNRLRVALTSAVCPTGVGPDRAAVCGAPNFFQLDGDTIEFIEANPNNDVWYAGYALRLGDAPSTGSRITDCTSLDHPLSMYASLSAVAVQTGADDGIISGNHLTTGNIWFYTVSDTDDQSEGWVISGNRFAPESHNAVGLLGGFKKSQISGNTFSGSLATGLVLFASTPGVVEARSGNNLVTGNTFEMACDTTHLTAILSTSAHNRIWYNTGKLTAAPGHQAVLVEATMPVSVHNNQVDFQNGTALVSAYDVPADSVFCANNTVTGSVDHVYAGNYGEFSRTEWLSPAMIYRTLKTWSDSLEIAQAFCYGYSTFGRPLVGLKLSDQASQKEQEPGLCYTAGMHGNEWGACNWLLAFADSLIRGYSTESRVTELLDGSELWLLPLLNPDGYTLNSYVTPTAYNLNREWPDGYSGESNLRPTVTREHAFLWDWFMAASVSVHADWHNALNMVLYPWGGSTNPPDDLAMLQTLAAAYTATAHFASTSQQISAFTGTTTGGMWPDWVHRYGGAVSAGFIEFPVRQPLSSELPEIWAGMVNSGMSVLEAALNGVAGVVVASADGDLLGGVSVTLDGYTGGGVLTDSTGYYFRPCPDGSTDLTFAVAGYTAGSETITVTGIETHNEPLAGDGTGFVARDLYHPSGVGDTRMFLRSTISTASQLGWTDTGDAHSSLRSRFGDKWQIWGGWAVPGWPEQPLSPSGFASIGVSLTPQKDPVLGAYNQLRDPFEALDFVRTLGRSGITLTMLEGYRRDTRMLNRWDAFVQDSMDVEDELKVEIKN